MWIAGIILAVKCSDLCTVVQRTKEIISLTWTEIVRGVVVQILAPLVLIRSPDAFAERRRGAWSFLGSNAQCCFVHIDRRIAELKEQEG